MSNFRVLAILFDGDSGNTFYAGQVVTGHVQFHASKRIQIRGVTLHVSGKAKTSWSEDHRPMGSDNQSHTQWYKGKEDYLNFELCVVGSTRDDSVVHIEPSLNNYPFSFVLPADMPQSFEGKFGHIRYKAKAVIHRRMSLDDKLNVPFTVLHLIDLNREPPNLREPLVMHGQPEASGCCWVSGVTEISATINRGCFVPGETLSIDGQIVNRTNANISYSTISLVQAIEFMATGSDGRVKCSKCLTTNLARVDRPLLQRGHTDSWNNVSLVVPQTYSSRLAGCRIINIRHSLEISPIFNEFSRKGLVSCPIVIGSIPLQNNFQPSVVTSQPMAYSATCNMTPDHMPPPSYESCIGFNIPVFQAPNNDVNSLPEVHRT